MAPTALTYQYTNRAWLEGLLSAEGVSLRLDDDLSGTESETETTRLTTYAVNIATSRVNLYAAQKYEPIQLANSWEVWHWGTIVGAKWLCGRRGNPVPDSLAEAYEEALDELKELRAGQLVLADIPPRDELWPAWSNIELDQRYWLRKLRVQVPISESQRGYRQQRSRWADRALEF